MLLTIFLLSGCVSLQDLRDDHAVWKDTTKNVIVWQEKEYIYLTDSSESYFTPEFGFQENINVTYNDVPLLLAGFEGDYGMTSTDEKFIDVYHKIYCLEDEYGEMKKILENPPSMDHFAYQYYIYDDMAESCYRVLSGEEANLFEKIIKECEENYIEQGAYEEKIFIAEICKSSEDKLFSTYLDIDLNRNMDGKYMLSKYAEEDYGIAMIPEQYQDVIEEIFADAIENAEEDYEEY